MDCLILETTIIAISRVPQHRLLSYLSYGAPFRCSSSGTSLFDVSRENNRLHCAGQSASTSSRFDGTSRPCLGSVACWESSSPSVPHFLLPGSAPPYQTQIHDHTGQPETCMYSVLHNYGH